MLKKFLKTLKRRLAYSRFNREQIQRDLEWYYIRDKSIDNNSREKLAEVIHCGAYYGFYDVKQYNQPKYIPAAIIYDKLLDKYVPNIDLEYPTNIQYIYEQFKKDILSSN